MPAPGAVVNWPAFATVTTLAPKMPPKRMSAPLTPTVPKPVAALANVTLPVPAETVSPVEPLVPETASPKYTASFVVVSATLPGMTLSNKKALPNDWLPTVVMDFPRKTVCPPIVGVTVND